jgi:hypothetical protein
MSLRYGACALAGALVVCLGALASVTASEPATQGHARGARDWSWCVANVDARADHLRLHYGFADLDPASWVLAARVGRPEGRVFPVQWLVDPQVVANKDLVEAVTRDLDFYLKDVGRPDPWSYAQYHCEASSNFYGYVHWECVRGQVRAVQGARE